MSRIQSMMGLGILLALLFISSARADEWGSVTAEDLGISQEEFQMVKEKGMSRSTLMKLLEVGVSPNEYFSEPWKKLGVSEDHWLSEKKAGMEDDDINRSYRKQQSNNMAPLIAFVLPGYYHYQTNRLYWGLGLSTVAAASLVLTFTVKDTEVKNQKSINPIFPLTLLAAMIWSAGDAYIHTRFIDNQEAQRFSLNLGPTQNGGGVFQVAMRF